MSVKSELDAASANVKKKKAERAQRREEWLDEHIPLRRFFKELLRGVNNGY